GTNTGVLSPSSAVVADGFRWTTGLCLLGELNLCRSRWLAIDDGHANLVLALEEFRSGIWAHAAVDAGAHHVVRAGIVCRWPLISIRHNLPFVCILAETTPH